MRNFYEILGILPSAEDVVITAAYRALANRYHPDKFSGDKDYANKKMVDINLAYSTLSDPEKKKKYDMDTFTNKRENRMHDEETEHAFNEALSNNEEKWNIAVKIYPDLADIRQHLELTSTSLSFAFVSNLLETKNFQNRQGIAKSLESNYFHTYFGDNQITVNFARELIDLGARDALKALNNYLEVIGSEVDPQPIIIKVIDEFEIKQRRYKKWGENGSELHQQNQKNAEEIMQLVKDVKEYGYFDSALQLISKKGFTYEVTTEKDPDSFFGIRKIYKNTIFLKGKVIANSLDNSALVKWVIDNLIA